MQLLETITEILILWLILTFIIVNIYLYNKSLCTEIQTEIQEIKWEHKGC